MPPTPLFQIADPVLPRSNRAAVGRITREPALDDGEYWYRVNFGKRVKVVVEDDLEMLEEDDDSIENLVAQGWWGRIELFCCALAVERITRENRSTVYSFKAQRILFEPYQRKRTGNASCDRTRRTRERVPNSELRSSSSQLPLAQFFTLQTGVRFARLGYMYMCIVPKICELEAGRSKVGVSGVRNQQRGRREIPRGIVEDAKTATQEPVVS